MTNDEKTEALRKAAKIGLTAAQAAEMIGVSRNTALRRARLAGFKFMSARRAAHPAKEKPKKVNTGRSPQARIDSIKKEAAEIACPLERREMIYGAALLAFEKKQAAENKRPHLPETPAAARARMSGDGYTSTANNLKPLVIGGVRFKSRTHAANELGVTRCDLSTMTSKNATPFRKRKLARLIREYSERQ